MNREQKSFAKITVKGRAGNPGVLRYTSTGKPVFSVNVAVSKGTKEQQKTFWFTVKAFGDLAEKLTVGKGDLVVVDGNFDLATWQDKKTGQPVQRVEILANSVNVEFSKNSFAEKSAIEEDLPF